MIYILRIICLTYLFVPSDTNPSDWEILCIQGIFQWMGDIVIIYFRANFKTLFLINILVYMTISSWIQIRVSNTEKSICYFIGSSGSFR